MLGALIGAGLVLASSIAGGVANRKARRKQEQMIAQQQKENQAWFDRTYNADPTKLADTVRLLTQMQEQIKNRNKAAKGRQAVIGGTEDSTTASFITSLAFSVDILISFCFLSVYVFFLPHLIII